VCVVKAATRKKRSGCEVGENEEGMDDKMYVSYTRFVNYPSKTR